MLMTLKFAFAAAAFMVCTAAPLHAQNIDFGDDSGVYSNDNACDDPRFVGSNTATGFDTDSLLHDATDCARAFAEKRIRLARVAAKSTVAECAAIDYGDDTSQWANDAECDDPRFAGAGVDGIMLLEDLMKDATDCKALCESGVIWLR
jgi:hypothetical protein